MYLTNNYKNIPQDSFVEKNGFAVIYAEHFFENESSEIFKWHKIRDLGHSKSVMQSEPLNATSILNHENAPVLEYKLFAETVTQNAALTLVAIPTHPVTTNGDLRIAVQWNNEPIQIINFKTEGRSDTWKENVLSNKATGKLHIPINKPGEQTLRIYMVDPGVLLDYIILDTSEENKLPYMLMNETKV